MRAPLRRRTVRPLPALAGPALRARDVSVTLEGVHILHGVDVDVHAGEVVALLGPNGAGKSTLLAALAGDQAVSGGEVRVQGHAVDRFDAVELARRRAVLPQASAVSFPFTVREVVEMGRAPWAATPGAHDDDAIVAGALERLDLAQLTGRRYPTLSGGERARVALARALVQCTPLLLLDEPTAALDLHHQQLVLGLARELAAAGTAVLVVLHDLALAAAHADRLVLLERGHVVASGAPAQVLRADLLTAVYGHPVEVLPHPRTGAPLVLPRTDGAP